MSEDSAYEALRSLIIAYADDGLSTREVYEKLEANHPRKVDAYLAARRRELMVQTIWTLVGQNNRLRRHRVLFAQAERLHDAGEALLLNSLPSFDGGRKTLVEMTKEDLLYSAALDEEKASGLIDHADFKRALAKRVPKGKTVGQVFSADQIAEFARRLFGEAA